MKKFILSLLCVVGLMSAATGVAVADDQSQYKKLKFSESRKTYKSLDLPKDTVTAFSRLTWSTNLVEWFLFAPNLGVEFDLKDPTLISCPSIFLQFSYRPGKEDFMKHEKFSTNALYYWRARAEYRWHFRLNERREQRRGLGKTAMWLDETLFTKKAEESIVDTSIVVEGGEYGTRIVASKEKRIQEKIDSTCNSTNMKKPELFPGRYYLGVYGEYDNITFNNDMLPIFGKNLKTGPMYQIGLSGGYDFPGFNYNHKCFLQWSVGASLGVFWYNYDEYLPGDKNKYPTYTDKSKVLPFITELKVALNFRNSTITNKYWQPDPAVYTDNIRRNHEDSIHMAELDTVLAEHPVIINVTSVNGFDSAFVESVDKFTIVQAFKAATGLKYLLPTDFNMLPHTEISLNNKELSDNYFIEYVTTNRLRNYTDSVFVSDRKNLPFRVQIAGREEADSLKKSFIDSLKNYYTVNESRPVFYGEPASKDSMKGFISKDSIAAKFSSIWGHPMDTSMIRTLYVGRAESNDDGTSTTYYDSVITEQNINRRDIYAMFIQFHPQVTLSGEDEGVGRFQVAMAGADNAQDQHNRVATFINKIARAGIMPTIQRRWDGRRADTFDQRVTKDEVYEMLCKLGMDSVDSKYVHVPDSLYTFTSQNKDHSSDTITFDFGVTEEVVYLPLAIADSVGRAQAMALRSDTIMPWLQEQYWQPNQGLYDDNPKVPGYYDSTEGKWLVSVDKFIESVGDITFARLKPYQIDTLVWRVQANPFKNGNFAGKYLAQAKIIFHREMVAGGTYASTRIPYLILPVETKEEAGFVEPAPINYDSLYSVARDSVVYSYDSLGNVIDSTIIHIEATNALQAGRDSVVYAYDSLGNVIDSTVIHIEAVTLDVAKDSVVAQAEVPVDTVKILSVAEATAASKEAAAFAKSTAATAKKAAADAKKAAAEVKKAQKAADAAIKKANKSLNIPDSTVVSSDSIVYVKDDEGNVIDSTVVSVEKKIAAELDSATQAAIIVRDSIFMAEQAKVDSLAQRADSLQAVADEAANTAAAAKEAAAEAKKAIAEAKAAEKAAKAEAKKKAKEAKAAAKETVNETVDTAVNNVSTAATAATTTAPTPVKSLTASTPSTVVATTSANDAVASVADTVNKILTVEEATAASNEAAAVAKTTAAEAKAAAAEVKKAASQLKKAEKAAAAAIKKANASVEVPENESELDEETKAAVAVRDSIIAAEQAIVDSIAQQVNALQVASDEAAAKAAAAKEAAASAKKAIAEAKAAEKAAKAEAKKRAKEEAAAAKAAAKAEADAAKEAVKTEAENVSEAVTEAAVQATAEASDNVATEVDTTGMSEKEAKAALKAAEKAAKAEAKKRAKEEAAAAKAAAKAAKQKAKEEAAAAKAAAKAEKEAANAESEETTTEAKE